MILNRASRHLLQTHRPSSLSALSGQQRTLVGLVHAIDKRVYRWAQSVLPPISKTENIALGCGTIGESLLECGRWVQFWNIGAVEEIVLRQITFWCWFWRKKIQMNILIFECTNSIESFALDFIERIIILYENASCILEWTLFLYS